jgi:hypothetical protein
MRPSAAPLLVCLLLAPALAHAETEPWSDDDGLGVPTRHEVGDYGVTLGAEYRANWLYVRPVNLTGTNNRNVSWIEHRLRLDSAVDYDEKVKLVVSLDALDGVLWGDNGTFGDDPSANSGVRAASRNPNVTRPAIGYQGGDELDPNSYGYVLVPADPVTVRRVYGELVTPIGFFRIGRQPSGEGTSILVSDGEGRPNRFGYSNAGYSADRILFATKPLEGLKPKVERDTSRDRGLFFLSFYDQVASKEVRLFGDDMHGAGAGLRWLDPRPNERTYYELQAVYAKRWESQFDTNVNITSLRAIAKLGQLGVGAEGVAIFGATREVSEALSLINNDPIVRQTVGQFGARGVARWDEPLWTAYFEFDYASGDHNPNPGTPLTQFYFAEDANVGLLMFERVLAFETGRSSAAGTALLRGIGAPSLPAERVNSRGSFTNAIAVFPQFDLKPLKDFLFRGGVLMAWSPSGTVDSTESLRHRDGLEIEDDLVNFNGGKPGHFYGTELDGRFRWQYLDHFLFDLEGAVLFPGDAFYDRNRQAARSVLVQGRTTFVF